MTPIFHGEHLHNSARLVRGTLRLSPSGQAITPHLQCFGVRVHPEGIHPEGHPETTDKFFLTVGAGYPSACALRASPYPAPLMFRGRGTPKQPCLLLVQGTLTLHHF